MVCLVDIKLRACKTSWETNLMLMFDQTPRGEMFWSSTTTKHKFDELIEEMASSKHREMLRDESEIVSMKH